jgi:hypothetical protein
MKKFVFVLIWILSIVSCQKPKEDNSKGFGELNGKVYFENRSNSAAGLLVNLHGYGVCQTNLEGEFGFTQVLEGKYTLSILQLSYVLYSEDVDIQSGKTTTIEIIIQNVQKDLPDFSVVDISKESTLDYWVVGKEEYFYIDVENSLPKSVFYHSFESGKDYAVTFDSKGLPSRVVSPDSSIFLFSNFNGNKVDLGILSPSGESQMVRGIKTDFTWPTSSKSAPQSRADIIRWTGRILAAIPCVTEGATALAAGGIIVPLDILALWTCGNYFLSMANNFFSDANVENGFTKFVNTYKLASTVYSCTNPDLSSCFLSLAQRALNSYANYIEEMDVRDYYINRLEVLLTNNTPPKKITFQPGPEGKDARITLADVFNPCREFYDNSGNDSIVDVIYDRESSCSVEFDKMLLQFSINLLPANAVISSAQLDLYGYATINEKNSSPKISIYSLKSDWSEEDVSWTNQPEAARIGAIDFVSTSEFAWHSWDVTNIVQDWVSGRKNNFGFEIYPANNYVWGKFHSGDHPNPSTRPKLVISYY